MIGIVGGIGSGKSAVARALEARGFLVAHSDQMGRAALEDSTIKARLVERWGDGVLNDAGQVDRSAVAGIVFADASQRRWLEAQTHPWIEAKRRALFASAPAGTPGFVIDAPLLIEAGLHRECDLVIFVDAPREQRWQRVQASRGWDEAELARREESQLPLDVKRAAADYVVVNDGDLSTLSARVDRILREAKLIDGTGRPVGEERANRRSSFPE